LLLGLACCRSLPPYTLALRDALPICPARCSPRTPLVPAVAGTLSPRRARRSLAVLPGARVLSPTRSHGLVISVGSGLPAEGGARDRKSTRLNYSHGSTSYAVVCFKKK